MGTSAGLVALPRPGSRFGAEAVAAGPVCDLTPRELEDLKDMLREHKVLGIRGQHLSEAEHRSFLARFGALSPPAAATPPGGRRAGPGRAPAFARWVTAGSHLPAPPKIVSLRAASADVSGECTLFADTAGAYRDLPRPLRALADRSWAVHGAQPDGDGPAGDPGGTSGGNLVAHPVTRLHPETGDRALLLGGHARQVLGLTGSESRTVIHLLQSYVVRPHNVLRWDWHEGDLLLVDARAVQFHLRRASGGEPGTTARLEVDGDPPLGVDGQHSHLLDPAMHRLDPAMHRERRSA